MKIPYSQARRAVKAALGRQTDRIVLSRDVIDALIRRLDHLDHLEQELLRINEGKSVTLIKSEKA